MVKVQKKGEKGNASNFITRTKAIRKLQISLADFRRLCILKGIYPREPNNKKKASGNKNINNTFYYTKDIRYLLHEPILQKIREHRAFLKKIDRAIARRDVSGFKVLQENEPSYSLDHIIKERYPSFVDALKDLDDCLCHVFLFATLPCTKDIPLAQIQESQRLAAEFQNFIIHSGSLKKSFLSIKGIYYQAEVMGVTLTWIVPYQFSTAVPSDIDIRVMLTFLEFYQTLMGFINYRLYSSLNYKYPPVLDCRMDDEGGWLASYIIKSNDDEEQDVAEPALNDDPASSISKSQKRKMKKRIADLQCKIGDIQEADVKEDSINEISQIREDQEEENAMKQQKQGIFTGLTVFISREVPRTSVEFVLRALGATVCYPESTGTGSPYSEDSPQITHQVVDRPIESISMFADRIYIQPQWAIDCLNAGQVLDHSLYGPGVALPPHLSPFLEYDATHGDGDDQIDIDEDAEQEAVNEIEDEAREAEVAGVSYSTFKEKSVNTKKSGPSTEDAKRKKEEKEKIERAKMVMSNKKRKVLESIERRQAKESAKSKLLARKKRQSQKSK